MKPLIVLLVSFLIGIFIIRFAKKKYDFALSARISMSIMLIFTAIGHFVFTKGMATMIPEIIPYKEVIVYITGVLEILFAIGLLLPKLQTSTGWVLIAFFVSVLPANIYASLNNINYQTGESNGNGLEYLWFRIPLQCLFIFWVYMSSIHRK